MMTKDVVAEHNGVYSGIWHIVSHEGFDLPEGLEYLKNSWEGDTQKYKANIVVKNISLKTALEKLHCVMYQAEKKKCVVKISDDGERIEGTDFFRMGLTSFLDEFIIHRCHLTFEDIAYTLFRGIPRGFRCDFSDNVFVTKNFFFIDRIADRLDRNKDFMHGFEVLDLRYCNFSTNEKELLRSKLQCCNLLI